MTRRGAALPREGSLRARIAAAAVARDAHRARSAADREHRAQARLVRRLTDPPPVDARGGFGRAAGRVGWRLRLPPLVTTSAQLCSVYPFVADPGLPADGPLIGLEVYARAPFCFSLHELYRAKIIGAPNMVVTGELASGKSSLLKCLAFRGVPFGVRYFAADYKGEYDRLAALTDVTPVRVGPGLGVVLNPLAGIRRHPQQTEPQWLAVQRARRLLLLEGILEIQLGQPLAEAERSLVEYALDTVANTHDATSVPRMGTPTLSAVLAAMGQPERWTHRLDHLNYPLDAFVADSRRVRLALQRLVTGVLGGVFDGAATTTHLDFTQAGGIIDLRAVRVSDQMTAMAMSCAQSWLEAELSTPDAPPRICMYDEFALLARHLPLVRRMREQLKLARAYGIGNILAFHRFSDLAAGGAADSEQVRIARGLIEDTGVRLSHRQQVGSLTQAQEWLGATDVETDLLAHLRPGLALWKVANRSYVVKHQLSTTEHAMVGTDERMDAVPDVGALTPVEQHRRAETATTGVAEVA